MNQLDKNYWDARYERGETQWDVGSVSAPLKAYIDQLPNKNISILIPGCGNAYEAQYLVSQGFTNITLVDISNTLVDELRREFNDTPAANLKIVCADFFELQDSYDLVFEQTFFCALDPGLRGAYADKMFKLLKNNGRLAGVLFNRDFEGGPPFGGNKEEYLCLFGAKFSVRVMEQCYNSIPPRAGTELFFILEKDALHAAGGSP